MPFVIHWTCVARFPFLLFKVFHSKHASILDVWI